MNPKKIWWVVTGVIMLIILIQFLFLVSCSKSELTREQAEKLYITEYPKVKTPNAIFLSIPLGSWSQVITNRMRDEEQQVYKKLSQMNLITFTESLGDLTYFYESRLTEEGKKQSVDTNEEGGGAGKIKICDLKFVGCTGVLNLNEKKEAIAEFSYMFVNYTRAFDAVPCGIEYMLCRVNVDYNWIIAAKKDPKATFVVSRITFNLYDDGWRLEKKS